MKAKLLIVLIINILLIQSCKQNSKNKTTNHRYFDKSLSDTIATEKLTAITDEEYLQYGARVAFINDKADTIIPFGKYAYFGTDTLEFYANVIEYPNDSTYGRLIAIDKNQNILFDIVMFDNGPEYFNEELTRVLRNGKMGFANKFGQVVIPCKYNFAQWFENGKAKVTYNATLSSDSEDHQHVESKEWFLIDKKGNKVK
ncbi:MULTISPECIES: WG repeat-containing protein [Flavobacterium]|uniref:WG repeat-containing protein n=1 Tax=Flavobacterium jumunjinense TaxID=998845 RepID=A0ABV5GIG7_9FLAO|nr:MULTISPECIES: WG repeat-containing protein [Flavobacterium]